MPVRRNCGSVYARCDRHSRLFTQANINPLGGVAIQYFCVRVEQVIALKCDVIQRRL